MNYIDLVFVITEITAFWVNEKDTKQSSSDKLSNTGGAAANS